MEKTIYINDTKKVTLKAESVDPDLFEVVHVGLSSLTRDGIADISVLVRTYIPRIAIGNREDNGLYVEQLFEYSYMGSDFDGYCDFNGYSTRIDVFTSSSLPLSAKLIEDITVMLYETQLRPDGRQDIVVEVFPAED